MFTIYFPTKKELRNYWLFCIQEKIGREVLEQFCLRIKTQVTKYHTHACKFKKHTIKGEETRVN